MSDLTNRIQRLEQNVKVAEEAKIRAEVELKEAEKRKAEIEKEMEELGVNPITITTEIKKLETEIDEGIKQLEGILHEQ